VTTTFVPWGENDGGPAWTKDAQAWYERQLRQTLRRAELTVRELFTDDERFHYDARDRVVAWFMAHPQWGVEIVDSRWFRPGLDEPEWAYREDYVLNGLKWVSREVRQDIAVAREAREFPTLETWLSALHRGEITSGARQECHAHQWITGSQRSFQAKRARVRRNWPHACARCGADFKGGRADAKRCPACRRGRSKKREARPAPA
jgi:hypothetical protein